jgi:hypothetical protein
VPRDGVHEIQAQHTDLERMPVVRGRKQEDKGKWVTGKRQEEVKKQEATGKMQQEKGSTQGARNRGAKGKRQEARGERQGIGPGGQPK